MTATHARTETHLSRRKFLASSAAVGAGLLVTPGGRIRAARPKPPDLNVAVIGCGQQGATLMSSCLKMAKTHGICFRAVCDIWEHFKLQRAHRTLKAHGHPVTPYVDYRDMLDAEEDLDVVIVATPDWMHAGHTIACLEAGLHVYCEKEMSNDIEKAKQMVLAARRTGKLLQIGHQRRSNPRYIHCLKHVLQEAKLIGRVTHACGQWNRRVMEDQGMPLKYRIDDTVLREYGYGSGHEFRNWRWFKKYGGGPIVDLGSHQIDAFSWFLGANPATVMADGGVDYYPDHEWYDNVMAIFEYPTPTGPVRASYQVLTTTARRGYFEDIIGVDGVISLAEGHPSMHVYRDDKRTKKIDWLTWARKGYIEDLFPSRRDKPEEKKPEEGSPTTQPEQKTEKEGPSPDSVGFGPMNVGPSRPLEPWRVPVAMDKPIHQPHLENFFDAIRGGVELHCPAEVGYETAVAVLKVNEAVAAGRKLTFQPGEFKV